jgi:hypothetical protein
MKPQPEWFFWGGLGALALILVIEWLPAAPLPVVPVPTAPAVAQGADQDEPGRDTAHWAEVVDNRPLFSIGRHPPHVTGNHLVVSSNGMPRLSGIMIAGNSRRAIFVPEGGKAVTVDEGGQVDGNTVRTVRADSVVLSGPKGDVTLRLSFDKLRAFVNAPTPGVFPNNGFNPGFNFGAGGAPFINPVQLGQQPPQPPPPQNTTNDEGDAGTESQQAPPQPFHPPGVPVPGRPNFPRDRE